MAVALETGVVAALCQNARDARCPVPYGHATPSNGREKKKEKGTKLTERQHFVQGAC